MLRVYFCPETHDHTNARSTILEWPLGERFVVATLSRFNFLHSPKGLGTLANESQRSSRYMPSIDDPSRQWHWSHQRYYGILLQADPWWFQRPLDWHHVVEHVWRDLPSLQENRSLVPHHAHQKRVNSIRRCHRLLMSSKRKDDIKRAMYKSSSESNGLRWNKKKTGMCYKQ